MAEGARNHPAPGRKVKKGCFLMRVDIRVPSRLGRRVQCFADERHGQLAEPGESMSAKTRSTRSHAKIAQQPVDPAD
ncbi:MAG TPA: hypothetical protein VGH36_14025 [Acetobacteraceae bacterium]